MIPLSAKVLEAFVDGGGKIYAAFGPAIFDRLSSRLLREPMDSFSPARPEHKERV
jgi:hypothetical protein